MKTVKPKLTDIQRAALERFAANRGGRWKADLYIAWMHADYHGVDPLDVATLQGIRNTSGPRWLKGFKLEQPKGQS